MGILDALKVYKVEWKENKSRKFTEEEIKAIQSCTVVASTYGKSVCFVLTAGKSYIPLEPTTQYCIGDTLDPSKLEIITLEYVGTDATRKGKEILRVRATKAKEEEAVDFDNPFRL